MFFEWCYNTVRNLLAGVMVAWEMIVISFRHGGTASHRPTPVIGLHRRHRCRSDIHLLVKSLHPTRSKTFWSCTSVTRRRLTSTPRPTTTANGWNECEPTTTDDRQMPRMHSADICVANWYTYCTSCVCYNTHWMLLGSLSLSPL